MSIYSARPPHAQRDISESRRPDRPSDHPLQATRTAVHHTRPQAQGAAAGAGQIFNLARAARIGRPPALAPATTRRPRFQEAEAPATQVPDAPSSYYLFCPLWLGGEGVGLAWRHRVRCVLAHDHRDLLTASIGTAPQLLESERAHTVFLPAPSTPSVQGPDGDQAQNHSLTTPHAHPPECFMSCRNTLRHYSQVVTATDSNLAYVSIFICFPLGAQVQILLVSCCRCVIILAPVRNCCFPACLFTESLYCAQTMLGRVRRIPFQAPYSPRPPCNAGTYYIVIHRHTTYTQQSRAMTQ
ncbi:hypothetical protein FA95DRAFT_696312 [Auriscalpium vulgare]|uniref:Uncharacterized protein n=1 Tax=Auriscalpium vulgare TaxID=40419 RepID=A0ACB8RCT1_9AGAM|nr:hypothetical protein FA95DRAFT_696312 [Auriscalpium vulgare]